MKYTLPAILFILAGSYVWAIYQIVPTQVTNYPEPKHVVLYDDKKCMVYEGRRHGALLYALICEDGEVIFTTNWLYVKEIKE